MTRSYAFRVLLIGFLPLTAALLYYEGQRYDPALLRFDRMPSDNTAVNRMLPEKLNGFNLLGAVRNFTRDTLYEYVDGHAEYFISAGFAGLTVGEYGSAAGARSSGPDVIVDIYNMGNSLQAFGVLSDESRGGLTDIGAGLRGFRSPSGLSFTSGRYYIKISSYNERAPLEEIASRIAGSTGEASEQMPAMPSFADLGAPVSTRYIKEAYRGLDFLNNVTEREYVVNGTTVQVFTVTREAGDIDALTESFIRYFKQSGIEYSRRDRKGSTIYKIRDRYEGDWTMVVSRDVLEGMFGTSDKEIINKFLKDAGEVKEHGGRHVVKEQ